MSVLTRKEILSLLKTQEIIFEPGIDAFQLQPHAIDLRLGSLFYLPKTWKITDKGREAIAVDPLNHSQNSDNFEKIQLKKGHYFEILPKEYIIASTLENISINTGDIMAVLYPRSSINRRGLAVDLTGIIDVWYKGSLMIPIINNTQNQIIRLYPGERICQISFEKLNSFINQKEGFKHGVGRAKYLGCDAGKMECKLDKKEEINYVKKGEIRELKHKFKVI